MAHQVETMAYANEVPWHGLGANVSDDLTPEEFMVAAGLDWDVTPEPMFTRIGGEEVEVPNRFALVRSSDNRILSTISDVWHPMQNRQVFDFMSDYVAAGGAKLETAGSLKNGELIWGLARLGHDFEVTPGDKVGGYLLFINPHKPGKAISIRTTTVRVVCANTMAVAEAETGNVHYSQNHMTAFDPDAARARIGEAHESLRRAEQSAKTLAKLKLSADDAVRKVLMPVFTPNALEDTTKAIDVNDATTLPLSIRRIMESVNDAPGAVPGTGWGVLNGVTHYLDHRAGLGRDTRLASSWDGEYRRRKLATEEKLLELAA